MEFCKDVTAPVVRECPDCIDRFIKLAYQKEQRIAELEKELNTWKHKHKGLEWQYQDRERVLVDALTERNVAQKALTLVFQNLDGGGDPTLEDAMEYCRTEWPDVFGASLKK